MLAEEMAERVRLAEIARKKADEAHYKQVEAQRRAKEYSKTLDPIEVPPNPAIPRNLSMAGFGKLMAWGLGYDDAIKRMESVTREEMLSAGMTLQMAAGWHWFYAWTLYNDLGNTTAAGRSKLMKKVVELLK